MERRDLDDASRDVLSRLLACDSGTASSWDDADLHAMLCHQLNADVEFDLTHFGGVARETLASSIAAGREQGLGTFGDLLMAPNPSLESLEMIRRFAKRFRTGPSGGLPEEIATVLYYAAIAAARARLGVSISKLTDAAMEDGLRWGCQLPWLTESLKQLFLEALEGLRPQASETDG